jgi:hypothetical protein
VSIGLRLIVVGLKLVVNLVPDKNLDWKIEVVGVEKVYEVVVSAMHSYLSMVFIMKPTYLAYINDCYNVLSIETDRYDVPK